jgi:hypothetical protein
MTNPLYQPAASPAPAMRKVARPDFFRIVNERAAVDYSASDEHGRTVTVHYDRDGNLIAAAAYGVCPGAIYRVCTAH